MARSFNGSTDTSTAGTIAGLNSATAATISAWLYRSSTGTTVGLGGCGGNASGGDNRFSLIWFSDGNLYFSAAQTGIGGYSYAAVSGTGWRHVALVYDGSQSSSATRAKLFVDGVQLSVTFVSGVGTALGTVSPWRIGQDASDRACGGTVAECGLWAGTALADAQVVQLSKGVPPPAVLKPTAYWPLIGRASPEIDPVGGYNLTLTGTSQADHPRVYSPAKRARAVFVPAAGGGGGSIVPLVQHLNRMRRAG